MGNSELHNQSDRIIYIFHFFLYVINKIGDNDNDDDDVNDVDDDDDKMMRRREEEEEE